MDFGVLASVGMQRDVAGNPPSIAPEALWGAPLDHRYDLYGLGALAYFICTGRHAFAARRADELPRVWKQRPTPPSSIVPDIPPRLNELILSLLSANPLARPSSAAEVIDRLSAIGGLTPHDEEVAHGYLLSAAMVGRRREMAHARQRIERAGEGSGRSIVVAAPSGLGKTRLVREIGIEAQIAGCRVVTTTGDGSGSGPYRVLANLVSQLLARDRDATIEAVRPYGSFVAPVLPEVAAHLGTLHLTPTTGDPGEDRLRLQSSLANCASAILERLSPIVVIVDDVQRSDEGSAAVLASLAHAAGASHFVLVFSLRTDEAPNAPAAVASLRDASDVLRLRGLGVEEIEDLAKTTFGNVDNLGLLSQWMHRIAGGSPFHSTQLLGYLVDNNIVRYAEGTWIIPDALPTTGAPRGLVEAMDDRVRRLSEDARSLGQTLSVHGGLIPLELCAVLGEPMSEERTFAALDELCRREVLVGDATTYGFRHDAVREALLRGLAAEDESKAHLRVGRALLARRDTDQSSLENRLAPPSRRRHRGRRQAARRSRQPTLRSAVTTRCDPATGSGARSSRTRRYAGLGDARHSPSVGAPGRALRPTTDV